LKKSRAAKKDENTAPQKTEDDRFSACKTEEAQTFSFPAPATEKSGTAPKTGGIFANSSDEIFGIKAGELFGTKKTDESTLFSTADKPGESLVSNTLTTSKTTPNALTPVRKGRGFITRTFDPVSVWETIEVEEGVLEEEVKEDGVSVKSGFWYMFALTFGGEEGVFWNVF
jgi:hypothetical protein